MRHHHEQLHGPRCPQTVFTRSSPHSGPALGRLRISSTPFARLLRLRFVSAFSCDRSNERSLRSAGEPAPAREPSPACGASFI